MDIGNAIQNVFLQVSKELADHENLEGNMYDTLVDEPQFFKNLSHHIQGPKPTLIIIGKCENQESVVKRVILDELETLIEGDGSLTPRKILL